MKVELEPWTVPNYCTLKVPSRPRQDGFVEAPKYALTEVDADVLSAMCDAFRAEVFRKSGKPDPQADRGGR